MTLFQSCVEEIKRETLYKNFRGWEMVVSEYLESNNIQSDTKENLFENLAAYVRYEKLKKNHKGRQVEDSNDLQLEDGIWAGDEAFCEACDSDRDDFYDRECT
mgnify:FL=1